MLQRLAGVDDTHAHLALATLWSFDILQPQIMPTVVPQGTHLNSEQAGHDSVTTRLRRNEAGLYSSSLLCLHSRAGLRRCGVSLPDLLLFSALYLYAPHGVAQLDPSGWRSWEHSLGSAQWIKILALRWLEWWGQGRIEASRRMSCHWRPRTGASGAEQQPGNSSNYVIDGAFMTSRRFEEWIQNLLSFAPTVGTPLAPACTSAASGLLCQCFADRRWPARPAPPAS